MPARTHDANAHDPLAVFTDPPPNETPEQKAAREKREAEEQRVSDRIDEDIKSERAALRKDKHVVKVLLLGQSESGKSTTLKNFRMKYAKEAWEKERASWRAVIQLNLIRSIITIVETLQIEMDGDLPIESGDDSSSLNNNHPPSLTDRHHKLKLRLEPLRLVEADLKRYLGAGTEEIQSALPEDMIATPFDAIGSRPTSPAPRRTGEFVVRSWKEVLDRPATPKSESGHRDPSAQATGVIASCRQDMMDLWTDDAVRAVLRKRNVRMEESAGFFLDDLDRIATLEYEPADDDVVRARLRTLGVQEHRLHFQQAAAQYLSITHDFGREWIMYDVGGSRTSRHAWVPYFENVTAIIFLAPVSCFDERLLEDPRVNRLEDSFILWKAICSSRLLSKTNMIAFLNKCDLLKKKLKSGVLIKTYLPSYGERVNDGPTFVKYLREKFKDTLKQQSPEPRIAYIYPTSVTDTKATAVTLKTVRDCILREHLKQADFV